MDEPIAVIGLDARFPGDGDTAERFYEFLLAGRSAHTDIPPERYNAEAFYHPDTNRPGTTRVRSGHFLKDSISAFDAPFFSITPAEARSMDPQQRGILESVYKALENAGISLHQAAGSQTGVYVGCMYSDYERMTVKDIDVPSKYAALGTVYSMLSNRVSWCFDLRGPSMTIDTACSSSLIALHQACNSLKLREASMAIVGGCNLILSQEFPLLLDTAGVLGPDGISYSFDSRGNGYSRGEGFGTVVLKRVSDAIRDGDVIRAVIRNTGSNQDGKSPGITSPTKAAQAELIRQTYARAGLDPSVTRFFEAHGTGTAVGDPIEASAISDVFTQHRSADQPLYIGALKSNIGHTEGAAGVAAIIKGVFTLERGVIPANTWFEKRNPRIQDSWNLAFPTQATEWPQSGLRRMSINSFGVGGTNAHVIMDDALHFLKHHRLLGLHRTLPKNILPISVRGDVSPTLSSSRHQHTDSGVVSDYEPSTDNEDGASAAEIAAISEVKPRNEHTAGKQKEAAGQVQETVSSTHTESISLPESLFSHSRLFLLSSYDQSGIARLGEQYRQCFAQSSSKKRELSTDAQFLRDLSYTLSHKRTQYGWRSFCLAKSVSDLGASIGEKPATRAVPEPRLAFIFTGQGAQWATMGRELMVYPAFQASLYAADTYLNDIGCSWSLTYELSKDAESSRVNAAEFSQPLCTALQVALVDLLKTWGVKPHAVAGHSSGEIAAAYAARQISRESAWRISFYRGKLSAQLASDGTQPKTGMAAVGADKPTTLRYIQSINNTISDGALEIACENSPDSFTVSGDMTKIDALVELVKQDNAFARKLNVELAYHSRYMKPMSEDYLRFMGDVKSDAPLSPEDIVLASSLHGKIISPSDLQSPSYWVENLVSPVRFDSAVTALLSRRPSAKMGQPQGISDILEIGPHSALKGPLRSIAAKVPDGDKIRYHSVLLRRESAVDTALEAAGSLWSRGFNVDISEVNQYNMASPDRPVMLTDLPSYAFNHSTEYWAESRISRNARLRSKSRHELLGAPVPDWNEHNATWRNYIRLSENPWIQDHKVAGESLYPAAGMLVMAIEASRQLADQSKVLRGFRFKNVSFHLALRVPEDDLGIESHFYLRPYRDLNENATTEWKEFQLWTCENDVWREHCHGLVQTEYEDSPKDLSTASLLESAQQKIKDRNGQKVSVDKIYKSFARVGLDFGPTFRTLQNARVSSTGDILATVDNKVDLIRSSMPKQYLQPHLVHPSTLDGVIQANLAPLVLASKASRQTIVPVFAQGLWVAASQDLIHDSYIVSSHCESRDEAGAETSFTALQVGSDRLMAYSSGVRFQVLPDASTEEETQPITHSLNLAWKGDPTYLDEEAAAAYFSVPLDDKDHPSRWSVDCDALSLLYMRQFLDATPESSIEKMEWFHKRYVAWMRHIVARTTSKIVDTDISDVEERVRTAGTPEGRLTIAVGQALNGMLLGDLNPLDVVFENKLAENVYRHGVGAQRCYLQMCNYIDSLAHKNPKMRILEVGAGTGGATVPAMKTLTKLGRRFDHYDFTDISPSFFEYAKESFKDQVENMSFRVLNIESKPTEQGFEAGAYDLILAANVLHATKDMDNTLSNVRSLLKPGGKLIIFELTNVDSLLGGFCFGVLSGWWLSVDPDREWGPLMTAESWKKHLQNVGFSGLDAVFNDFPDAADQVSSIMVSGVPNEAQPRSSSPVTYIIADSTSTLQQSVAGQISSAITEQGPIEQVTLDYLREKDLQKATCIMLTELDRPLLKNLTEETLPIMQKVIRDCREVFWVTQGGEDLVPSPDVELVTGFARSIREERPDLHVVTVSFDKDVPADGISRSCVKLLQAVRIGETDNTFRVNGSTILVPRLVQADYMTQHMLAQATQSSSSEEGLCRFDPDASYVIAGGFGGLGKSTALWMASRGAKNLILLSRSGPRDEAAREVLDDLERVCDRVAAPPCDITDLNALKTAITECLSTLPPIKGCIQGSMVLRDNAFTSMTFEEWDTGVRAKVQGSENLHEVLGRDLDFFILLSSTVALTGNPGQSNYGAANTFLDAFARKLVSRGEQVVALNLPVISDIGFVAEKAALLDELLSKGWSHLEEDEVHAVLDYHCRPREEGTPLIYSQVVPRLWLPQDTAFEGAEMPPWASDKLFSHIWPRTITTSASNKEEGRTDVQLSSLLTGVSSLAEAEKIVLDALLLKLSRVLSVELSNLDPAKAMHAYGVDSLVAVGLRAWFAKEVRAELSVFEMNDKPSIYALASTAAERSKLLPALPTNE